MTQAGVIWGQISLFPKEMQWCGLELFCCLPPCVLKCFPWGTWGAFRAQVSGPQLKKQTNTKNNKNNKERYYHSWAKASAARVCACAHCSTGDERAKQAERGRKENMLSHWPPGSTSFYPRRLLCTLTQINQRPSWIYTSSHSKITDTLEYGSIKS